MKLSNVVPVKLLLHAPHTLSTLSGKDLELGMVIKLPCYKNYYQQVGSLVNSGDIHHVGTSFYFVPKQSPMRPSLPSIDIEEDISLEELNARHLPTEETYEQ